MSLIKRRLKQMKKISKKPKIVYAHSTTKNGSFACECCGKNASTLIQKNHILACKECIDGDMIPRYSHARWNDWD
jgi:hypothetical protein